MTIHKRGNGRSERKFLLPEEIDAGKIEAHYGFTPIEYGEINNLVFRQLKKNQKIKPNDEIASWSTNQDGRKNFSLAGVLTGRQMNPFLN